MSSLKVFGMYFTVEYDREVDLDEVLSPGSYTFKFSNGESVNFDFYETSHFINGKQVSYEQEDLDFDSFPDAEKLADLLNECEIVEIEEFYIDLEGAKRDITPLRIVDCSLSFGDWLSPSAPRTVDIDDDVLKKANFEMQ